MLNTKSIPAKLTIAAKAHLTIPEIPVFANAIFPNLHEVIAQLELEIISPPEFIYFGIDGDPSTLFDLLITLPIKEKKAAPAHFDYYQSEAFKCATVEYVGSMPGIKQAWNTLYQAVAAAGLRPNNQCREICNKWVGFDSMENVIELQLGVED